MPINVTWGQKAQFAVEFLDSGGSLTIPSGGQIIVSYTDYTTRASTSQTITLVQSSEFFIGTWNSSVSVIGLATWSVYATSSPTVPEQSDVIRVIDP